MLTPKMGSAIAAGVAAAAAGPGGFADRQTAAAASAAAHTPAARRRRGPADHDAGNGAGMGSSRESVGVRQGCEPHAPAATPPPGFRSNNQSRVKAPRAAGRLGAPSGPFVG